MSGALATGFGIAEALSQFLQAGVTLDTVALHGFEVPERMPWGGTQDGGEHRLPGGAKDVYATGAFEQPYQWSGTFSGPFASQRARTLDAIRRAGKPVSLTWGSFVRTVLVVDFSCSYERSGFWCPYRIRCLDIPNVQGQASKPTLLGQIAGDIGDALGVPDLVDSADQVLQQAGAAVSVVQNVLPIAGALTGGSSAFLGVASAVGTAGATLGAASALANGAVSAISGGSTLLGSVSGSVGAVSGLNGAVQSLGELSGLSAMASSVSRVAANLGIGG